MARVHGDVLGDKAPIVRRVYELVKRIPKGRVMTYGQLAVLVESRISPRAVGWAMHNSPRGVPWQRVVNASGGTSTDRLPDMPPGLQRAFLESEGVVFRRNGTLDLEVYRWEPKIAAARRPKPRRRRT
jgi:methylated-DNA-protein-cysteine methyltransferase-like protein